MGSQFMVIIPMSFLVETEESATLEAALQFIDGFETKDKPTNAQPITGKSLKKRASQKRARRLPIKEELEQLRRLVPELEATLSYVRESRGWHIPAQRSLWVQALAHEYRRRRQAEATNDQLKRMLANLLRSMRTSRAAITEPMPKEDLALLYEPQIARVMSQRVVEESLVVSALADRLQTLKLEMDSVMKRAGLSDATSRFSRKLRQVDSKLGVLIETSCCFPISDAMELTADRFWEDFRRRMKTDIGYSTQLNELNGHRKTHVHDFGQTSYRLSVRMSARKHVEGDRVVVMWSSVAPMVSKGVRFNLDTMVVIKRASASLDSVKSGSLLQGWFRVNAERFESPESFFSEGRGIESLSDHVMDAMSNHLTNYLTMFKSAYD